jgi:hypothetical protein
MTTSGRGRRVGLRARFSKLNQPARWIFLSGFLTPIGIGVLTVVNWRNDRVAEDCQSIAADSGSVHPASLRFRLC